MKVMKSIINRRVAERFPHLRKAVSVFVPLLALLLAPVGVYAQSFTPVPITVVVDGVELPAKVPESLSLNGVPYIYFETLARAFNGNLEACVWETTTKRMTMSVGDMFLIMQVGSPAISIATVKNGVVASVQNYSLPVTPILVDDFALVSLEHISVALGATYSWNQSKNTANILTNPVSSASMTNVSAPAGHATETQTPVPVQPTVTPVPGMLTPVTFAPSTPEPTPILDGFAAEYAEALVKHTNVERQARGLSKLEDASHELNLAAQIRVNELMQSFSHTRPNGDNCFSVLAEAGVDCTIAGENTANGYTDPAALVADWINSAEHSKNMLNPDFTKIGIGVATGEDGIIYCIQIFTD